jgi:hypothetical protein
VAAVPAKQAGVVSPLLDLLVDDGARADDNPVPALAASEHDPGRLSPLGVNPRIVRLHPAQGDFDKGPPADIRGP